MPSELRWVRIFIYLQQTLMNQSPAVQIPSTMGLVPHTAIIAGNVYLGQHEELMTCIYIVRVYEGVSFVSYVDPKSYTDNLLSRAMPVSCLYVIVRSYA